MTRNILKPRDWVALADWLHANLDWYEKAGGTTLNDVARDAEKELKFKIQAGNVKGVLRAEELALPVAKVPRKGLAPRLADLEDRVTDLAARLARLEVSPRKTK